MLFRAHHPTWEVHIHLIIPRAPQTPPTSATVRPNPPHSAHFDTCPEPVERKLNVRSGDSSESISSAYLTDGETIYKQAIFTAEQLGIANQHAQDETDGLLYWEEQPTKALRYRVVEEAILTNPNSLA